MSLLAAEMKTTFNCCMALSKGSRKVSRAARSWNQPCFQALVEPPALQEPLWQKPRGLKPCIAFCLSPSSPSDAVNARRKEAPGVRDSGQHYSNLPCYHGLSIEHLAPLIFVRGRDSQENRCTQWLFCLLICNIWVYPWYELKSVCSIKCQKQQLKNLQWMPIQCLC